MQVGLLGTVTGQLRHAGHCLALTLTLLDLVLNDFRHISMDVQVVIDLLLDEVADILVDAVAVGRHLRAAQLDLRLALEDGFLDVDGDGRHDTGTDVTVLVLAEELLDGFGNVLLEGTLVGTALRGVLAVDERVVLLAILVGMGKGYLNVIALQVDDGVQRIVGHAVLEQVLQTMTAEDAAAVVHHVQSRVQVGIVTQHIFHDFIVKPVVLELRVVRFKINIGTILVLRRFRHVRDEPATLEDRFAHLAVAVAGHLEMRAQGIHRLDTDTVQANRLLESLGVELATGVQNADALNEFALRDASSVVTDGDAEIVFNIDFDTVAGTHLEFVNRVVEDLL